MRYVLAMSDQTKSASGIPALYESSGKDRRDLMRQLDVSENTVRRWERGEGLTIPVVLSLATFFEVSTDEILGRK